MDATCQRCGKACRTRSSCSCSNVYIHEKCVTDQFHSTGSARCAVCNEDLATMHTKVVHRVSWRAWRLITLCVALDALLVVYPLQLVEFDKKNRSDTNNGIMSVVMTPYAMIIIACVMTHEAVTYAYAQWNFCNTTTRTSFKLHDRRAECGAVRGQCELAADA